MSFAVFAAVPNNICELTPVGFSSGIDIEAIDFIVLPKQRRPTSGFPARPR